MADMDYAIAHLRRQAAHCRALAASMTGGNWHIRAVTYDDAATELEHGDYIETMGDEARARLAPRGTE